MRPRVATLSTGYLLYDALLWTTLIDSVIGVSFKRKMQSNAKHTHKILCELFTLSNLSSRNGCDKVNVDVLALVKVAHEMPLASSLQLVIKRLDRPTKWPSNKIDYRCVGESWNLSCNSSDSWCKCLSPSPCISASGIRQFLLSLSLNEWSLKLQLALPVWNLQNEKSKNAPRPVTWRERNVTCWLFSLIVGEKIWTPTSRVTYKLVVLRHFDLMNASSSRCRPKSLAKKRTRAYLGRKNRPPSQWKFSPDQIHRAVKISVILVLFHFSYVLLIWLQPYPWVGLAKKCNLHFWCNCHV